MTLIRELEALKVAADETLILRFPESQDPTMTMDEIGRALDAVGLMGRCLVLFGDVEVTVAKRVDPETTVVEWEE